SLNRLIRCVCGKKIGPDPRNFNQRVNLGRNDLLIRTFPNWKNWEWLNVGMGISKPLPLNPTPGIAGNIGSSIGSEGSGAIIQEQLKNQQEKK
ncbi:hypothetical protein R9P00_00135, partial [Escherichia coli]